VRRTECIVCGTPLPPPSSHYDHRRKYCSERCRKSTYGQACVDCGTRTTHGAEGPKMAEPRCGPCSRQHRVIWTAEKIIERIQAWATVYGEPPAMPDWNPWDARHRLRDEARAERFEAGSWPTFRSVVERFGTWNAGITAAGFAPRAAHGGGGNELRHRDHRSKAAA
jgi:hypothetical protein